MNQDTLLHFGEPLDITLVDLLDEKDIRDFAGREIFKRGVAYFRAGRLVVETATNYESRCRVRGTRKRQERVDTFQNDPEIPFFLISLKAGGVGLNLTAADYVIHIDPWWNPAVEIQATDRTHRIGQEKPVFVYKLITRDSVEEKILLLQDKKRALVEHIITAETSFFKSLTTEDSEVLFS